MGDPVVSSESRWIPPLDGDRRIAITLVPCPVVPGTAPGWPFAPHRSGVTRSPRRLVGPTRTPPGSRERERRASVPRQSLARHPGRCFPSCLLLPCLRCAAPATPRRPGGSAPDDGAGPGAGGRLAGCRLDAVGRSAQRRRGQVESSEATSRMTRVPGAASALRNSPWPSCGPPSPRSNSTSRPSARPWAGAGIRSPGRSSRPEPHDFWPSRAALIIPRCRRHQRRNPKEAMPAAAPALISG